jgi:polar amino acid transport system substrate-binding protein
VGADTPLRVGMELSYPPFETICKDGKPCGLSVDIAYELGKYLDREVTIDNIAYVGLVPSLNSGKIDLIISSLTANSQRERAIAFSDPYLTTGLCLLVNAKSSIQNIEQANKSGVVIVVKSGTTGEMYAMKHLQDATVRVLDKESLCVLEVVQGKADAFIYDQFSIEKHFKKHPDTTRAILTPFDTENWAIGLRKDDVDLLKRVNAFIAEYKAKGWFEKQITKVNNYETE